MEIAIVLYEINNPGGIINHTEVLAKGFKELGHSVELKMITTVKNKKEFEEGSLDNSFVKGEFGLWYNQYKGWNITKNENLYFKDVDKIKETLSKFDLIIWSVPVIPKSKGFSDFTEWQEYYDIPVKQLAIVHDGNLQKLNSHFLDIQDKITGVACVHSCAYETGSVLKVPRALILNPQIIKTIEDPDWDKKEKGFLSPQTFKAWKRVEDTIKSIPFMDKDIFKGVAGEGIELCYLKTENKDKMKPHYLVDGVPIWKTALENGLEYLGVITNTQRDEYLRKYRTLIDSSESDYYNSFGGHFNRTVIEAMIQGCIPLARELGVLFKENDNFIKLPPHKNLNPKEFAEVVNYTNNLDKNTATKIQENNFKLIKMFDYIKIAEDFLKLAEGKPCGYYNKIEIGGEQKADSLDEW